MRNSLKYKVYFFFFFWGGGGGGGRKLKCYALYHNILCDYDGEGYGWG